MGSYAMDSHNCQRVIRNGGVINEGDVQLQPAGPYPVSYRCIVPRRSECTNLLVPVCASASHIAFGSLRMEPVFMALAELRGKRRARRSISHPRLRTLVYALDERFRAGFPVDRHFNPAIAPTFRATIGLRQIDRRPPVRLQEQRPMI